MNGSTTFLQNDMMGFWVFLTQRMRTAGDVTSRRAVLDINTDAIIVPSSYECKQPAVEIFAPLNTPRGTMKLPFQITPRGLRIDVIHAKRPRTISEQMTLFLVERSSKQPMFTLTQAVKFTWLRLTDMISQSFLNHSAPQRSSPSASTPHHWPITL